jgi:hypothetical protein
MSAPELDGKFRGESNLRRFHGRRKRIDASFVVLAAQIQ